MLDREGKERYLELLNEKGKRQRQRKFFEVFPDATVYAPDGSVALACDGRTQLLGRNLYPKHLEFLAAGARYRSRLMSAGNRVGKTFTAAYELTAHLTGLYPDWWEGKTFNRAIRAWAAGKTNETTRDIVQLELLGDVEGSGPTKRMSGTGMIPGMLLGKPTWKSGVQNLVDTIKVQHVSGRLSVLGLKAYEQGRGAFEGTAQDVIWPDEQVPREVYEEMMIRTATTNGILLMTATPIETNELVLEFMPRSRRAA